MKPIMTSIRRGCMAAATFLTITAASAQTFQGHSLRLDEGSGYQYTPLASNQVTQQDGPLRALFQFPGGGDTAFVNYGVIKVATLTTLSPFDNGPGPDASVGAGWSDLITITLPGGGVGVAHIPIIIDGSLGIQRLSTEGGFGRYIQTNTNVALNFGGVSWNFTDLLNTEGSSVAVSHGSFSLPGVSSIYQTWIIDVPFTSGLAFPAVMYGGCYTQANIASIATCSLDHSIYWGGVKSITQSDGSTASSFEINSASGTDYRTSLRSAVPEPATWAYLVAGFVLIGWTMRTRRARVSGDGGSGPRERCDTECSALTLGSSNVYQLRSLPTGT